MTKSSRLLLDPRQFASFIFTLSTLLWVFCCAKRRFEFQKRRQLLTCPHNETPLFVVAMRISNPDCSPVGQSLRRSPSSNRLCFRLLAMISQYRFTRDRSCCFCPFPRQ